MVSIYFVSFKVEIIKMHYGEYFLALIYHQWRKFGGHCNCVTLKTLYFNDYNYLKVCLDTNILTLYSQ